MCLGRMERLPKQVWYESSLYMFFSNHLWRKQAPNQEARNHKGYFLEEHSQGYLRSTQETLYTSYQVVLIEESQTVFVRTFPGMEDTLRILQESQWLAPQKTLYVLILSLTLNSLSSL